MDSAEDSAVDSVVASEVISEAPVATSEAVTLAEAALNAIYASASEEVHELKVADLGAALEAAL